MTKLTPGDQAHFLKSGFIFGTVIRDNYVSEVSTRGQTITFTASLIAEAKAQKGRFWLDYLHTPERQIERWGEVKFAPGRAPEDLTPWEPNTPEADMERQRQRRRKLAWALVDPQEQADALRAIDRIFGRVSTSKTINVVRGGNQ